jgi:lysophospholipase L1-like esterase
VRLKTYLSALLALAALSAHAASSVTAAPFALHDNDTVVFYGDSITDQRMYTMLTELFVVTRYPKLNVTFVHSGWGGDRVTGGGGGPIDTRLERDVIAYHPSVMTIMLGMNDGNYANHTAANDTTYFEGYQHIIDSVRKSLPDLRLTLIGPSPFDDVTRPFTLQPDGYNAVMKRYSVWLDKYAHEHSLGYADLNTGVVAMLQKANGEDPALAQKIIPDRVHPAIAGHLIMAEQLLKAWRARPEVSEVTIDAARGKVAETAFTTVTDFHAASPLVWTQTDEALPLPFANMLIADHDHTLSLAIKSSDVTQMLNQQPLRVTGLAPGHYKLTVDGDLLGTFGDSELAKGINLAILDTPMSRQALEVRDLTVKRIEVHQQRWRVFQVPLSTLGLPNLDETLKAMDGLDKELAVRQRAAAQPMPHVFQVTAVQ